ncbi:alanine racemase [Niveispirillum sp. KHB5.9]|uniref:alanine racemase n=1 Tax=Niveispirillum sp. KHB5.9 TaxID=3400269 RepID=UPI003A8A2B52
MRDAGPPTPHLVIDRDVLDRNLDRMRSIADRHRVQLRPHMKTTKSVEIALLAQGGRAGPITVSTLREARYFAESGFTDILYAITATPARVAEIASIGTRITIVAEDAATAAQVGAACVTRGVTLPVLIDIDCGYGRSGLRPDDPQLSALGRLIHDHPGLILAGVMTHAGQAYDCRGIDAVRVAARQEVRATVAAANLLRAHGLPVRSVSIGSTPTMLAAQDLTGITEIRPGNYQFLDLTQAAIGVCTQGDIALRVVAELLSHHPSGHALIDAGALALSKDTGADGHYGIVARIGDNPAPPGLFIAKVAQEQGYLRGPAGLDLPTLLPVGTRVEILPNHACMTAAAHDFYHVRSPGRPPALWRRANGWH